MKAREIKRIEDDINKYGLIQFRKYDEYLISNLIDNKLTFGSANNFNDPFDCNLPINLSSQDEYHMDLLQKFPERSNVDINKRAYELASNPEKTKADIHKLIYDCRRFSCFNIPKVAEHLRNSKFWANYANKHQGVCLKFSGSLQKHYYDQHSGIIGLVPIKYCETDLIPKFNYIQNQLNGKPEKAVQYFFGTKSKQWEDENEVRFVYTSRKEVKEPYINFKFDPNCLEKVYIGCRINEEELRLILKCLSDKKYDHVDIVQLEMDSERFTLNEKLVRLRKKI